MHIAPKWPMAFMLWASATFAASPVADQWVLATVRVVNEWGETGTGFLTFKKLSDDYARIFLVTNKHVVHDQLEMRLKATKLTLHMNKKGSSGNLATVVDVPLISNGVHKWREHPDPHVDILVVDVSKAIGADLDLKKVYIGLSFFGTKQILEREDIRIGDEVLVIGYPLGIAHARTNMPIVRQGIIASNIGEPILGKFELPDSTIYEAEIPAFLIDAAIVPGSSGSPVILKPVLGRWKGDDMVMGAPDPYLLGIVSAAKIASIRTSKGYIRNLANLGVVFDASEIVKTIELLE